MSFSRSDQVFIMLHKQIVFSSVAIFPYHLYYMSDTLSAFLKG